MAEHTACDDKEDDGGGGTGGEDRTLRTLNSILFNHLLNVPGRLLLQQRGRR